MKKNEKKSFVMRIIVLAVVAAMIIGIVAGVIYEGAVGTM